MMLWPKNWAIRTHLETIDAGVDVDRVGEVDAQQDDVQVKQWAKLQTITQEQRNRVRHRDSGRSRIGPYHWNHEQEWEN